MAFAVPQFNESTDKWTSYLTRLEAFFVRNAVIDAAKRRALLVSALSAKTIEVLEACSSSTAVNKLPYAEVVQQLGIYYAPKLKENAESFKFFKGNQNPDESIQEYCVALRPLAETCNFGDTRERLLRDRIVCGITNADVGKLLLTKRDLTLQAAEDITLTVGAKTLNIAAMKPTPELNVNAVTQDLHRRAPLARNSRKNTTLVCSRCDNSSHDVESCKFKNLLIGHISRCCRDRMIRKKRERDLQKNHEAGMNVIEGSDSLLEEERSLFTLRRSHATSDTLVRLVEPVMRKFVWAEVPLKMLVDTGFPVSAIPQDVYRKYRNSWPKLQKISVRLSCFLGTLSVLGELSMRVKYQDKMTEGSLIVHGCSGPSLCGRDLIRNMNARGVPVFSRSAVRTYAPSADTAAPTDDRNLQQLLEEFVDLFKPGLGTVDGPPVSLIVRPDAQPKFARPNIVPYALCDKVSSDLDRLVAEGVLSAVSHSAWAAPIVPVVKKGGNIGICWDFKLTVNSAGHTEQNLLPVIEDIIASLCGDEVFSTLDLKNAYHQLCLDEYSRRLAVINTLKGFFCYNRLPFGIASAPAAFQPMIENILKDLQRVQVYLDDVLVAEKQGDSTLRQVLQKLWEHGVKMNRDKCKFRQKEVNYLGHKIDAPGLHPKEENLEAVMRAPRPQNVSELRSYLGLITYYSKFLPNILTLLVPVYALLVHA